MQSCFDASALLALLFDDPGARTVVDLIADRAAISAGNFAEVALVLTPNHQHLKPGLRAVRAQVDVEPFTDADTLATAALAPKVTGKGLSLADRACLALAQRWDAPAFPAYHVWSWLPLNISVQLLRRDGT